MCNSTSNSLTSYIPTTNTMSLHVDDQELHRWPTLSQATKEIKDICKISGPTTITGLILYSRAMISMLFLGHLGNLELAGGSLAIAVANITGYSVISGLAMAMDPICAQAYGAKQMKLLGLTLHRTILLLLVVSIPIAGLWFNIKPVLLLCNQDEEISSVAQNFVTFAVPDLFFLSFLHPLRIYMRTQGVTVPVMVLSAIAILLHIPLNFLLVKYLEFGVAGVAMAMAVTNLNLVLFLCLFIWKSGKFESSWISPTAECLRGWSALLRLAVPTCISVCLEWWWYEVMIMLCGLMPNPRAAISSMGILIQTTSFIYVFPWALSLAAATRVGTELGAGRPARARVAMIVALICSAALGVAALVFAAVMRKRWGRFFTDDVAILELTAAALPIAGLCELGNCPQTTGCGVLRGSARPAVGANINLWSFYLVGMPAAFVMGFGMKMGFPGLWVGLLAAQISCAVATVVVLSRTDWRVVMERGREMRMLGKKKKKDNVCHEIIIYTPTTTSNDEMEKSASASASSLQLETNPLLITTHVV